MSVKPQAMKLSLVKSLFIVLVVTTFLPVASDDELSIVIVGNMMFGQDISLIMDREGSTAPFVGVSGLLKDADITFGVLDGPITVRGEPDRSKQTTFRSQPIVARGLSNAGFDVVAIATPHILDYGPEGLIDTMEFLAWYGVKYVGAGRNMREAKSPVIINVKGCRVAFIGYLRGSQFEQLFYAKEDKIGTAFPVLEELQKDVLEAKGQADVVIAFIHWGTRVEGEGITERQRLYAQKLIDSGVDVVIGQRTNALQGIETYNNRFIIYSLGDFIYGSYAKKQPYGYIAKLIISSKTVSRLELIPVSLADPEKGSYLPNIIRGESAKSAIELMNELSKDLGSNFELKDSIGILKTNLQIGTRVSESG